MPAQVFEKDHEWKNNLRIITQMAVDRYAHEKSKRGTPIDHNEWNAAFNFLIYGLSGCPVQVGKVSLDYCHKQTIDQNPGKVPEAELPALMQHLHEILDHIGHEEYKEQIQPYLTGGFQLFDPIHN